MEVYLRPSTAARIRSALGEDVSLAPAGVPGVLARLAVEAPDVYSQVLAEISGSQVRLDSEMTLRRRWRRGLIRRLLFGWGEYESDVGDRLIAKRHVAAAVPIGLAVLILMMLGISHFAGHHPGPAAGRSSTRAAARTVPSVLPPPARRSASLLRDIPPSQRRGAPPSADLSIPDLAVPDPGLPPALPWGQMPLPPSARAAADPASHSPDAAPHASPVVYMRQPVPDAVSTVAALRPDVASRPPSPIVYDRAASEAAGSSRPPGAGLAILPPRDGESAAEHPRWTAGQRIPAHLSTGVVVVAGGPPMPVVAESTDPASIWLGRATLGPEGLVQITFTPEGAAPIRGVALDPGRLAPGLAGRTALRHPQAAGTVITATLQGATDYAQALARQGQVTLTNGWAQVIDGSAAPAWTYVVGRLAQGFNLQGTSGAPVATTELDPGTPLVILLTEAP